MVAHSAEIDETKVRAVLRDYNRLNGCGLTLQEMDDLTARIVALVEEGP